MVAPSDARALREALGSFVSGVTVITCAEGAGQPVGVTVSSFCSLSLDPPMVLWCLARNARSVDAFLCGPGICGERAGPRSMASRREVCHARRRQVRRCRLGDVRAGRAPARGLLPQASNAGVRAYTRAAIILSLPALSEIPRGRNAAPGLPSRQLCADAPR